MSGDQTYYQDHNTMQPHTNFISTYQTYLLKNV